MRKTINSSAAAKALAIIACLLACCLTAAAEKKRAKRSPVEEEFGALMRKQEARARKQERSEPRPARRTPAEELEMLNRFLAASAAAKGPAASQAPPPRYNPSLPQLRATNPKDGSKLFAVRDGAHLFDGNGKKRGKIAPDRVQVNYGQTRMMRGADGKLRKHHYVFATSLEGGGMASGWVRAKAFVDKPRMRVLEAKRPPAGPVTAYRITGGGVNRRYADLKVVPRYDGPHRAAADYGRRPGGYVNQTLTLPGKGGISTDTWRVGTVFRRTHTVPSVVRPLYRPGSNVRVGGMRFVYGYVNTPTGPRYGWMAHRALSPLTLRR